MAEDAKPETLWRNRDYNLYWFARAASVLGSQATYVAFPLFALSLYGDLWRVSLVTVATYAGGNILSLHAGVLGDVMNRKHAMVLSDVARVAFLGGLAAWTYTGTPPLIATCATAFTIGALGTMFNVVAAAALPDVVGLRLLPRAVARNESRDFTLSVLGPPVGAFLYLADSFAPFAFNAVCCAASAGLLGLLRASPYAPRHDHRRKAREPVGSMIRHGIRFVWNDRPIRYSTIYTTAMNTVLTAGTFTVVTYLGAGGYETVAGYALAAQALVGFIGSVMAETLFTRLSGTYLVALQGFVWSISLVLIGFVDGPWWIVGLMGLPWLLASAMRLTVATHIAVVTGPDLRARVAGVRAFAGGLAGPLGPLLAGVLAGAVGYTHTVTVFGGVAAMAVLAFIVIPHSVKPLRFRRPAPM